MGVDRGVTVLLAEDNDGLRALCREHLEAEGLRVVEAANGYDALAQGRRERPALALVDVVMPGLDGHRVAELLLREQADLRVVFLSGRRSFEDQLAGLELGAVEYVTKPFDPAMLVERVRELLGR